MLHLLKRAKQKRGKQKLGDAVAPWMRAFRERVCFSLRSRAIGPLAVFGARRENVLRGAGYAWTPGLRVFDNSKR